MPIGETNYFLIITTIYDFGEIHSNYNVDLKYKKLRCLDSIKKG